VRLLAILARGPRRNLKMVGKDTPNVCPRLLRWLRRIPKDLNELVFRRGYSYE